VLLLRGAAGGKPEAAEQFTNPSAPLAFAREQFHERHRDQLPEGLLASAEALLQEIEDALDVGRGSLFVALEDGNDVLDDCLCALDSKRAF